MSIPVACQCGQRFMAQPHLAGQFVLCPVCGMGISVPTQTAPQAYAGPAPPQVSAPYGAQPAHGYRPKPQERSGGGPFVYLGIGCGVLALFLIAAVAVAMIGYDLARTTLKPAPQAIAGASSKPATAAAPIAPPAAEKSVSLFPSLPSIPSLSAATGDWKTHTSESGKFSVSLPGTIVSGVAEPGLVGGSSFEQVVSRADDGSTAMVVLVDFPLAMPPDLRDGMLDDMINSFSGAIAGDRVGQVENVTLAGHSGRGFRFERQHLGRRALGRAQLIEVQGRIYQLFWFAPEGLLGASAGDPFFSSFKLLPGAGSTNRVALPGAGSTKLIPLPGPPGQPPGGFPSPPRHPMPGGRTVGGPVVIFQMLGYSGTRNAAGAVQRALAGIPWFNNSVLVDNTAGEIVVGVRGSSVSTGEAKTALEAAGFQIGSTQYKPQGR